MAVKDCYHDCECPDCGEPIPDETLPGEACANCGHVFWDERKCDDE